MVKSLYLNGACGFLALVNRFLFFIFLPEKGKLSVLDRIAYRFLVKMVFVEKRLRDRRNRRSRSVRGMACAAESL